MEEIKEEISLVANIIDKLLATNESLRADQLVPLTKRLRSAVDAIDAADRYCGTGSAARSPSPKLLRAADGMSSATAGGVVKNGGVKAAKKSHVTFDGAQNSGRRRGLSQKESPLSANGSADAPRLHVSGEVSRSLCCSLYNILESAVSLLRASHGHIFVKNGDDMASIANVAKKLVFPPKQVHHRCMGNADAEVLGSSIALNRFTEDVSKKGAVLVFPIFGKDKSANQSRVPIATIHVERKEYVFEPFNSSDECILYFAAMFCGELMSRVPHFDWLESFYDPATQHIVAPFVPYKPVTLPGIRRIAKAAGGDVGSGSGGGESLPAIVSHLSSKMEALRTEVLVRRETLPSTNSKPFAPGVTHMPSLLEIQAYVDNLQSCWRKNMTENVDLMETDRGTQQDLKAARSELMTTRRQLAAANERLRLYELESKDYKYEYGALKTELNTYMDNLDRLQ